MPRLRHVCWLLLLVALLARASQVQHLDTRALTISSSDVLIGRIQDTHAHWNASHTKIFTEVTVQVTDALKGAGAPTLTVTQLGGSVGNLNYEVEGGPVFTPGEDALLFLWRDARGVAQVNGLAQGKFDITRDARTGQRLVQRREPGLAVTEAKRLSLAPAGRVVPPIPLDDMIREIRATLAEGGR